MFEQLLAITRNTFFESIRQPLMLVVLVAAALLLILSNPLAAFTMENDQRMLIDLGMATVFLGGTLLAAFIATSVLSREVENRTALTVISKPVGRPLFVVGKYMGVAGAMLVGTLAMAFTFLLVEQHAVLQTVRDPVHVPVVVFGVSAAILGLGVGVWCNYFYGMAFTSSVICAATPLLGLAYLFSMMFRHDFTPQKLAVGFRPELWMGLVCLTAAILVLTAIAVAASTRLGQVMTLVVTVGVFILGMLSDWLLGRPMRGLQQTWLARAEAAGQTVPQEVTRTIQLTSGQVSSHVVTEQVQVATQPLTDFAQGPELLGWWALKAGHALVPNFQVLLLSDAITQKHLIPGSYVGQSLLYALASVATALCVGVLLFQRREVG
jgi:ABC-type transport system involved in multi-copper enzyme maturation permease subunit